VVIRRFAQIETNPQIRADSRRPEIIHRLRRLRRFTIGSSADRTSARPAGLDLHSPRQRPVSRATARPSKRAEAQVSVNLRQSADKVRVPERTGGNLNPRRLQ